MWRRQGKVSFTPIEVVGNDEPMLETLCDVVVCITGRFTVWFRMLFNEYFHWMLIHIFWLVTRINQMLLSMNNSVFDWVHTSFLKQQLVLPSKVLTCHVQIPMLCGHRRQRVALVPTSSDDHAILFCNLCRFHCWRDTKAHSQSSHHISDTAHWTHCCSGWKPLPQEQQKHAP